MRFDDLRLRTKTVIPVCLMGLMMISMVGLGASRMTTLSSTGADIIGKRDRSSIDLSRSTRLMMYLPYSLFGAIVYDNDAPGGQAAAKDFAGIGADVSTILDEAGSLLPEKAGEIGKFKSRFLALLAQAKPAYEIAEAAPGVDHGRDLTPEQLDAMAKATKLAQDIDIQSRALVTDLKAFNDGLLKENAEAATQLGADSNQAVIELIVIGGLALLIAGGFALWMASAKIARPLGELSARMKALAAGDVLVVVEGLERRDEVGEMARAVEVFKQNAIDRARVEASAAASRSAADSERERSTQERTRTSEMLGSAMQTLGDGLRKLAAGDLTTRLEQGFAGDLARIRDDFNLSAEKLAETLRAVVESTNAIRSGTQEISSASDDLSHRTEQQAASLEETAAALEEITQTVKKSAEGARHAADVVANADNDAKKGAVVVKQAVEAMDAIAGSSDQIGKIIGVIDEIAFQTNLLALNAGVEAARAGDAGRGFAVVASEVRALAQRSADAAKQIKGLISTSATQVKSGVELVAETGKALDRIISQVTEINRVVTDIASGAQEQAAGLLQVNTAINQMDQSTQQNATMVEESTAASHSLSQETSQLASLVEQFRVGDNAQANLRRELEKAAPHAFAKASPPPPRAKSAPPSTRPEPKVVTRSAAASSAKRVKAAAGGSADGWDEF